VATKQYVDSGGAGGWVTEAPTDGQTYGRKGQNASWDPVLPLTGGTVRGKITVYGTIESNQDPGAGFAWSDRALPNPWWERYSNYGTTYFWNGLAAKNYLTIDASGNVTVDHDPIKAFDVATKQYVNNAIAISGGEIPSDSPPLMDGVAAPGVSLLYSREDHVHPTNTFRAPTDSPIFTTRANAPTPTFGDNSTKIATTAFVDRAITAGIAAASVPDPGNADPLMDETAAPGVSLLYSREDYVHPTDTSLLPLAGGTMTRDLTLFGPQTTDLMAATKLYVDQAASAATLWQEVYDPTTNTPDLNSPAVQNHGWSWTVNVAGDTAANLPEIPAGTALQVGDVLQWIGAKSAYAIIAGGPLTEVEADARYLRLAGGTMTGSLILAADPLLDLEAATKQYVDTHSTNANYVAITGDMMTGNLAIDTTAAATSGSLTLTRNAGLLASIYGSSGPNIRWAMDLGDNTPETGTNTGSDFLLSCYTDAGVLINTPLRVIRASGDGP
jgi:hypothetical protein